MVVNILGEVRVRVCRSVVALPRFELMTLALLEVLMVWWKKW